GHAHPGDLVRGGGQGVGVLPGVLALVELAHLALGVVFHDLLPPVPHRAVGGLVHAGDDVEGRSLARAVGADQGDDLPLAYLQIHVVHGDDAAELHGDILQTKDLLTHFAASFFFDFPERRARRLRATSESSRSPMRPRRKNSTTIMMMMENTTIRKPVRRKGTLKAPIYVSVSRNRSHHSLAATYR
ncbi:ribosome recycling factor, partial [Dysosmobacter welbionis]